MTGRHSDRDGFDLGAIAIEAEVELVTARAIQVSDLAPGDLDGLVYYEAELASLRDAATSLEAAEHGETDC